MLRQIGAGEKATHPPWAQKVRGGRHVARQEAFQAALIENAAADQEWLAVKIRASAVGQRRPQRIVDVESAGRLAHAHERQKVRVLQRAHPGHLELEKVGLRRIDVDRPHFLGPILQKVEHAAAAGTDRDQALGCVGNQDFDLTGRVLVAG